MQVPFVPSGVRPNYVAPAQWPFPTSVASQNCGSFEKLNGSVQRASQGVFPRATPNAEGNAPLVTARSPRSNTPIRSSQRSSSTHAGCSVTIPLHTPRETTYSSCSSSAPSWAPSASLPRQGSLLSILNLSLRCPPGCHPKTGCPQMRRSQSPTPRDIDKHQSSMGHCSHVSLPGTAGLRSDASARSLSARHRHCSVAAPQATVRPFSSGPRRNIQRQNFGSCGLVAADGQNGNGTACQISSVKLAHQAPTRTAWPRRDTIIPWRGPANQETYAATGLVTNLANMVVTQPADNPDLSAQAGYLPGGSSEKLWKPDTPLFESWNDDALVAAKCLGDESICLGEIAQSTLPSKQLRDSKCFTWTREGRARWSRSPQRSTVEAPSVHDASNKQELVGTSAPTFDVSRADAHIAAEDPQNFAGGDRSIHTSSLISKDIASGVVNTGYGLIDRVVSGGLEEAPPPDSHIRYSTAVAEGKIDIEPPEIPSCLTPDVATACSRVLLEFVCKQCLQFMASSTRLDAGRHGETFANGKLMDMTRGPIPLKVEQEPLRDTSGSFQEPCSRSGGLCDEAECRSVIENLFFDSLPSQQVDIHSIETVAKLLPALRFLRAIKDESTTAGVVFYAPRPEHVESIVQRGILAKGFGAHVCAHAGMAHLGAEPDRHGRRFVCVLLVAEQSNGGQISSEKRPQNSLGNAQAADDVSNVNDESEMQLPFDEEHILVSHLITYGVQGAGQRRTERGFDDPFLCRLISAVQRAASRQRNSSARSLLRRRRQ